MTIAQSEEQRLFEESIRRFLQTENEFERLMPAPEHP